MDALYEIFDWIPFYALQLWALQPFKIKLNFNLKWVLASVMKKSAYVYQIKPRGKCNCEFQVWLKTCIHELKFLTRTLTEREWCAIDLLHIMVIHIFLLFLVKVEGILLMRNFWVTLWPADLKIAVTACTTLNMNTNVRYGLLSLFQTLKFYMLCTKNLNFQLFLCLQVTHFPAMCIYSLHILKR